MLLLRSKPDQLRRFLDENDQTKQEGRCDVPTGGMVWAIKDIAHIQDAAGTFRGMHLFVSATVMLNARDLV